MHSVVGKKRQSFTILLLLVALLLAGPMLRLRTQAAQGSRAATEAEVFAQLNENRAARGLSRLQWSDTLADCAAVRASEISVRFSHNRPDGRPWYSVNPNAQYGENLIYLTAGGDAATVFATWASSRAHRALFYDAGYTTAAIARYSVNGTDYWVIEFGYGQ